MMPGNGQLSVPPGFRFHPTDEELLYYYLRKKVANEPIDLDVIRDVDLNKFEPWDLKDKCRIGSGPQNEWYFFSHKDKKYPTGTRTNRATTAGFWKATGRDKAIHISSSKRIGMRKTLVFYTGRAPNGQKTDWIMHEYRLDEDSTSEIQEDGWVVCRVFKKKSHQRGFHPDALVEEDCQQLNHLKPSGPSPMEQNQNYQMPWDFSLDNSMHLPQLLSAESAAFSSFNPPNSLSLTDIECSQNLMKLTAAATAACSRGGSSLFQNERLTGDWSILEKLLASHQNLDQLFHNRSTTVPQSQVMNTSGGGGLMQRFPLQYLGYEGDMMKFPK